MATRIETLGSGGRAPRSAWIMLFAVVLIAAALAIGALIGSNGGTTTPERMANENAATIARDTDSPGLIKGGLQPRPYSPIVVEDPAAVVTVPDGFIRMPGGEVRPMPGN
ncbi:MAG TPA: hypothetical protein VFM81_10485 [Actinomycetota bacterium]|nr:hypothetical protein [Actinomycetota bacterium]